MGEVDIALRPSSFSTLRFARRWHAAAVTPNQEESRA